jgi:putative hydrolase
MTDEARHRSHGFAPSTGPPALLPPSSSTEPAATRVQTQNPKEAESAPEAQGSGSPPGAPALDWKLVEAVAKRVAGQSPPNLYRLTGNLVDDLLSATEYAELLVSDFTGLYPKAGPATAVVVDRPEWIDANVEIFQRYLAPVSSRLAPSLNADKHEVSETPASGVFSTASRAWTLLSEVVSDVATAARVAARSAASVEIGVVLGFLSRRVLGQYDIFLPEERADTVYYVGPNVLSIERQFGFPPKDFRLWIALHECTHRAQFTGVSWMAQYFGDLVASLMEAVPFDPKALVESIRRVAEAIVKREDPLGDLGLAGVFATPEQHKRLQAVQALMCLLEGHGNIVMESIGERIIPSASRMSSVLKARRASNPLQRLVFRLVGIETKLRQYELGEAFVKFVLEEAGPRGLDPAWQSPENLPTLEEINDPKRWLARVSS